jgi:hypothetical protein
MSLALFSKDSRLISPTASFLLYYVILLNNTHTQRANRSSVRDARFLVKDLLQKIWQIKETSLLPSYLRKISVSTSVRRHSMPKESNTTHTFRCFPRSEDFHCSDWRVLGTVVSDFTVCLSQPASPRVILIVGRRTSQTFVVGRKSRNAFKASVWVQMSFFVRYIMWFLSHSGSAQCLAKTNIGNYNHGRGKPFVRGNSN